MIALGKKVKVTKIVTKAREIYYTLDKDLELKDVLELNELLMVDNGMTTDDLDGSYFYGRRMKGIDKVYILANSVDSAVEFQVDSDKIE